jgi:hypothetical protein
MYVRRKRVVVERQAQAHPRLTGASSSIRFSVRIPGASFNGRTSPLQGENKGSIPLASTAALQRYAPLPNRLALFSSEATSRALASGSSDAVTPRSAAEIRSCRRAKSRDSDASNGDSAVTRVKSIPPLGRYTSSLATSAVRSAAIDVTSRATRCANSCASLNSPTTSWKRARSSATDASSGACADSASST